MKWKYIKPLESENRIEEYETITNYTFPEDYKDFIRNNNGGRPERRVFDTEKSEGRSFKSLLSYNHNDRETVWKIYNWNKNELGGMYIPFATDDSGNLICFEKISNGIVFINTDDLSVERIADSFSIFINSFYELT